MIAATSAPHTLPLFSDAPAPPQPDATTVPGWVTARAEQDAATLAVLHAARASLTPALAPAACVSTTAGRILDGLEAVETIADDLWAAALEAMVTAAETAFAHPSGLPLRIPREDVREHFQRPTATRTRARATMLPGPRVPYADIWQHLDAQYNQAAAREAAQTAVLQAFIARFLHQSGWRETTIKAPVWRSGYLILDLSVFAERWVNGEMRYTYHAVERIRTSLDIAAAVFQLMESPLADGAREAHRHHWGTVATRARYAFAGGLRVVTYQKKLEIEVPPGGAEALMALLAPAVAAAAEAGLRQG